MNPKELATETAATDHDDDLSALTDFLESRLDPLVDCSIEIAKQNGYAPFTTTIRAAWVEAILSVTESLTNYLAAKPTSARGPQATLDYKTDPRFARMRFIARQHRSLGITMPMYVGLFKHFRNLYITELKGLPSGFSPVLAAQVRDFFDETELSISADWYNSDDNVRLRELQERARAITLDKDRYFAIFESLRNPAFLLDTSHTLLNANQAAAEMFLGDAQAGEIIYLRSMRQRKYSMQEVIGQIIEAMGEPDHAVWLKTLNGARCFDVRMRGLHDAVQNIDIGYVVLLNDVTEHRRAAERAQQSERGMSRFLATMSHEIRTPLHSVLGATELLRTADTQTTGGYLDLIENAGQTLLQTLNNVLDYSKLANEPPLPRPSTVSLSDAMGAFERIASVGPGRDKARLSFECSPNLPNYVQIDWAMVQQVLSNLVSNAIRADDGRGVSVSVRRCSNAAPALRFEVRDHGPGIPAEDGEALFRPFEKANARDTGSGGSGLGLAIAHHLVEALRGRIGYRNRENGALVWFEIPAEFSNEAPNSKNQTATLKTQKTETTRHCLLVDDDPIGGTVTALQLERLGFQVVRAGTLAQARAAVSKRLFDVFIVDYTLPDGDGASLVKDLRSRLPDGPRYVALTANVEALESSGELSREFDEILAKPIDQGTLSTALNIDMRPVIEATGTASQNTNLDGLSADTVQAMTQAFQEAWDAFRNAIQDARNGATTADLAHDAHRLAGSSAILGLHTLEGPLRELERRWSERRIDEDIAPILVALDVDLSQLDDWSQVCKIVDQ